MATAELKLHDVSAFILQELNTSPVKSKIEDRIACKATTVETKAMIQTYKYGVIFF